MHSLESSGRREKLFTGFVRSRRLSLRRLIAQEFRLSEIGNSSRCTATVFSRPRGKRRQAAAAGAFMHWSGRTLIDQESQIGGR